MSGAAAAKETEKQTTIIVNGREKEVVGKEISFRQVVDLAFSNAWADPNTVYTVTYTRGADPEKTQGTLVDSKSVQVKNKMIFNVTATNRS